MLTLYEGERVITAVHRHWIVVAQKMTLVVFLLSGALVFLAFIPSLGINPALLPLIFYLFLLYMLVVLLVAFVLWVDYYLDVLIITTERVIDVEQKGMFRREASEFSIASIQDVTVEIPGFVATLLRYGTIRIQTAGNQSFTAYDIPNIDTVKNIILAEVRKRREPGAERVSKIPSIPEGTI